MTDTLPDTDAEGLALLPDHALRATGVGRAQTDAPLFYVDGATEGTTQWKAETLQVVNWGGFEGAVRVPFHPGAVKFYKEKGLAF